jgi:hypothetical protein
MGGETAGFRRGDHARGHGAHGGDIDFDVGLPPSKAALKLGLFCIETRSLLR